ncbi:MAG: hypothetical protein RLZ44_807 [Pseudomonadota bacterium]|jgi:hypothetical protein
MWRELATLSGFALLAGCAATPHEAYHQMALQQGMIATPTPAQFSVCHQHTCAAVDRVGLSASDWLAVRRIFAPAAADAAAERAQIAAAVAQLERLIAPQIGAENDRGGNLAGVGAGGSQLDCVDESTNTTTYLTLLEQDGLLRWHSVVPRATRNFVIFGWPHTTAVIREHGSEERWAVDSWFHDNGAPPEIVPLAQWRDGWSPPGFRGF